MTRTVTLELVSGRGERVGTVGPFEVSVPWWQEVDEIAGRCGVQVLRLLSADRAEPPGGHVVYVAEVSGEPGSGESGGLVGSGRDAGGHPGRAAYAEVGGPAASIGWAKEILGGDVVAYQTRTWNLSAIWRLDRGGRPVAWLKQVPAFFGHEPAAIRLIGEMAPGLVPPLIAAGAEGRMVLAHVAGEDRYGAGADLVERIAAAFHPVQEAWIGREPGPIPAGRLDGGWLDRIAGIAAPHVDSIAGLRELIDDLPGRLAAVEKCGLPDTLVHGDLHPGNVRTVAHADADAANHGIATSCGDGSLTILDWGDCFIGHPGFDILRLGEGLDDPAPVLERWAARWRRTVPGSDPLRAVHLLRPVAALRLAGVYASFLDAIEPSEWPYHAADVPRCLAAAASMVGE